MSECTLNSLPESGPALAHSLNQDCYCASLDKAALRHALLGSDEPNSIWTQIEERPHLFSDLALYVDATAYQRMVDCIAAIEQVIALPAYQEQVLSWAPALAHLPQAAQGVFMGYDFHLERDCPQLIEINTNAGGAMLTASLAHAHQLHGTPAAPLPPIAQATHNIVAMFQQEWQLAALGRPLSCIAIVDEQPQEQFLYPEFLLFARLFQQAGWHVIVCDPGELHCTDGLLWHGSQRVDLVYNRLTDFSLAEHEALRSAYQAGHTVITPHPRAHALYADKRNLLLLSDEASLCAMAVPADLRACLRAHIPKTEWVNPERAEDFWARRKQLFFKPASGFGSKATYRGDKLTKRVFAEIVAGQYVAQSFAPPGLRRSGPDAQQDMKVDLRHYVYQGRVQHSTARLYQGQTTNFRTPGGGFAPLIVTSGLQP